MGYDIQRFEGEVDEELMCPICHQVLEDPLQVPQCEHAFCSACIKEWLARNDSCPVDRTAVTSEQLKPVPRILRNLLARLKISCGNKNHGCNAVVKLDALRQHLEECMHNPKRPVECEEGCGLVIPKDELGNHNCVRELRTIVQQQQARACRSDAMMANMKQQIEDLKSELNMLKEYVRAMRVATPNTSPSLRAIEDEFEHNEVVRWVNSVPTARVTRWGGMISTPDAVLQAVIKRSLIECGCPSHILNDLMENAHERNWPPGLNTLETRQMNRHNYEQYVTRRIPGKQAVLVMYCENAHMGDVLIVEPGIVMIFAHGIE